MFDLLAELHRLPSAFEAQDLLDRTELPPNLMLFIADLAVASIETSGRFYEPSACGPKAVIVPVYHGWPPSFVRPGWNGPEAPHDLIAFEPDRPSRWWWRTGSAVMLGGHLIDSALLWDRPVWLVATALEYLRARCSAVCLLDPDAARQLIGVPSVIVGSAKFGRRIDRLWRKPPAGLPKIFVKERAYDPA